MRRMSTLDPPCFLMPPNTPHGIDPMGLVREEQDVWPTAGGDAPPWSSGEEEHDEGMEDMKAGLDPHGSDQFDCV